MEYLNRRFGGFTAHFGGTKRKRLASLPESLVHTDWQSAPPAPAEGPRLRPNQRRVLERPETSHSSPYQSNVVSQTLRHLCNDAATQTSSHYQRSLPSTQGTDTAKESLAQSPASVHSPQHLYPSSVNAPDAIVEVTPNSRERSTLNLTDHLLKEMCQFVEANRELEALELYHIDIKRQVGFGEIFIDHHKGLLEDETDEKERAELIRMLEERESSMLRDNERKETSEKKIEEMKEILYWCQADLRRALEPSLIEAGLLESRTPEDYAMGWENSRNTEDADGDAHDSAGAGPVEEEIISEEELERRVAQEELDNAAEHLNALRDEYENQAARERDAIWGYKREFAAGEVTFPIEEMYQYLLQQSMALIRALIEAEEQCDKAAARARALGILGNAFDQESHFVDYSDDGQSESYQGSEDGDAAHRAFIESWQSDVPESPGEVETPEVDDWDAKTIEIGDSLSDVDYTRNRRRIDRWQFICESCGQNGDCGALGKEMIENGQ